MNTKRGLAMDPSDFLKTELMSFDELEQSVALSHSPPSVVVDPGLMAKAPAQMILLDRPVRLAQRRPMDAAGAQVIDAPVFTASPSATRALHQTQYLVEMVKADNRKSGLRRGVLLAVGASTLMTLMVLPSMLKSPDAPKVAATASQVSKPVIAAPPTVKAITPKVPGKPAVPRASVPAVDGTPRKAEPSIASQTLRP